MTGWRVVLAGLLAFLAAAGVAWWSQQRPAPPQPPLSRLEHQRRMQDAEVKQRFEQAVAMLHAKQYDHAIVALHRVLEIAPAMPEAMVNMGFALLGLNRADDARGFFLAAVELRPTQANAYYGLAMAEEQRNDLPAALGSMRSYLHLSPADDPYRAKARSALWEWEQRLGRHRTP